MNYENIAALVSGIRVLPAVRRSCEVYDVVVLAAPGCASRIHCRGVDLLQTFALGTVDHDQARLVDSYP